MKKSLITSAVAVATLFSECLLATHSAVAQLTILHDFNTTDGSSPDHGLVQASDGNFYGTTPSGGTAGLGTVFQLTPAGSFTVLVSFTGTNGSDPECALVQGSDGLLYGTTLGGGPLPTDNGTIFKVTTGGDLQTLFAFPQTIGGPLNGAYLNGRFPAAGLVQGSDGEFYGTNTLEGMRSDSNGFGNGTVFKISSGGDFQTLFTFYNSNDANNPEGADPRAPLALDPDGSFYSTTYQGGTETEGTIFRVTASGVQTDLYDFNHLNASGGAPFGGVVLGPDNKYYGMTEAGGSDNLGTYYRISHEGIFELLGNFTGAANGAQPFDEMIVASDGNLYGTTSSGGSGGVGTIFQLTTAGVLTTVYTFPNSEALGAFPRGTLTQGKDGALYGTTMGGGTANVGTVFRLDLHLSTVQLTAAVSRKTHGAKGDFDLPLVLDSAAGGTVEPRANGPTTIVFTFSEDVQATDGMISANEFTITNATYSSASISGNTITLNLSNVIDQSVVSVALNGISDTNNNSLTGDNDVEIRALAGDADQSGTVEKADSQAVKAHRNQALDQMSGNYLFDLNLSGSIGRLDSRIARMNVGHSVP